MIFFIRLKIVWFCCILFSSRGQSLKLLAIMSAIRLDDEADNIESTLTLALMDPKAAASTNKSITADPLASSSWDKVVSFTHRRFKIYGIEEAPAVSNVLKWCLILVMSIFHLLIFVNLIRTGNKFSLLKTGGLI